MTSGDDRHLILSFLALVLVSGAVAPAFLTGGIGGAHGGVVTGVESGGGAPVPEAAATTPPENASRHENPDEVDEDGDLGNVQSWLLGQINDRLEGSSVNVSRGRYEAAEGLLGNETRELLGQYVDVAGETESEEDDETAETVNETVAEQRDLAQTRRNYSETYEAYLEARENGNLSRARRLARELGDLQRRLNRTAQNLTRNYRTIEDRTGIRTDDELRIVNLTARNVSETQAEIREELFDDTSVVIEEYTSTASPIDPLVVRGRVVTENGAPVTEGVVRLRGVRDATATIDATGGFTLRHHPILLPRGATNLTLEYRPPVNSSYLGSTTGMTVTIRERPPTIELTGIPDAAGFGETLSLGVRLTVENRSIEGVPVEATLGGVPLDATVTAEGTTTLSGAVPAGVDDGLQEVRVTLPIGEAVVTLSPFEVSTTQDSGYVGQDTLAGSRLRTNLTAVATTRIRVRGRLETADGTPVPGQSVRINIAGVEEGSVRTNATGAFSATVTVPESVTPSSFGDRGLPVTVQFAAPETNLAPSTASGTITALTSGPDGADGLFGLGVPWWAWLALLALVVGIGAYLRRSRLTGAGGRAGVGYDGDSDSAGASGAGLESESGPANQGFPASLLEVASERLASGMADTATEAGYEAVRRRLAERLEVTAGTHWELYRACQAA
ncbi:MAG: hypothetical protein ABEH66_05220, partial [Halobacteriales archaeon]